MTANLKANLLALCESADLLWSEYIQVGPGKMSPSAGDRFTADAAAVENSVASSSSTVPDEVWVGDLRAVIQEVRDLLRRCVEQAEGLSFVTGEAGLIPRRDLHEKCETGIRRLRELAEQLSP